MKTRIVSSERGTVSRVVHGDISEVYMGAGTAAISRLVGKALPLGKKGIND